MTQPPQDGHGSSRWLLNLTLLPYLSRKQLLEQLKASRVPLDLRRPSPEQMRQYWLQLLRTLEAEDPGALERVIEQVAPDLLTDYRSARLAGTWALTGSALVNVPPSHLPIWASPQALALAAWLTVLLTLIGVILTAETLKAAQQGPAPVKTVIVSPSATSATP